MNLNVCYCLTKLAICSSNSVFARRQSEQVQTCLHKCERAREPDNL